MEKEKKLKGEIVSIEELSMNDIDYMYDLMAKHYENIIKNNFLNDLYEKKDVILLRNSTTREIKGFSTLMLIENKVRDSMVKVLFSGDTIIDKEYWGTQELPKYWGRYAFSLIENMPNEELYWFLMTKGYKTYRFLPIFFNEFFPRRGYDFPLREKEIIDTIAYSKFGSNYNFQSGIVSFNGKKDHLKEGVADIDEIRLKNPDIKFFYHRNPGWKIGDELACIIKLTKENFNKMGHKIIGLSNYISEKNNQA